MATPAAPTTETPFLPGTASLVEELDQYVMVMLRDGRKLIGILRSFDQFANLVLESTVERIIVGDAYCDIRRGIYLIRGENTVFLGLMDESRMNDLSPLRQVPESEILRLQKEEEAKRRDDLRARRRFARFEDDL